MTSERSPLLVGTESADPEAGSSRPRRDELPLATRVARLIADLKRSYRRGESLEGVTRAAASHDTADLATLLYAASVLDESRVAGTSSIRDRLAQVAMSDRLREAIYNRIEDLLDGESQALLSDEDGGPSTGLTADAILGEHSEVDGEVEEMCWRQWDEDGSGRKTVSVMDLLLPPRQTRSSPFLSHPLVRHGVHQAWRRGVRCNETSGGPRRRPGFCRLLSPRAWHALHLFCLAVLYASTLSVAIRPTGRIQPYDEDDTASGRERRASLMEALWAVHSMLSLLIDIILRARPLRLVLLSPTYLGVAAYISSFIPGAAATSQSAYSLIVLSIPALTLALILPIPSSLPLLAPESPLIPLSTLLLSTLNRSLRPLVLLTPIIVFILALFSWSMNGDIFRGFWTASLTDLPADKQPSSREEGIAPFAARTSLFVTMLLLLLAGITLGTARSMAPSPSVTPSGGRRWQGNVRPGDDWEEEYSLTGARRARKAFALAVRQYIQIPVTSVDTILARC